MPIEPGEQVALKQPDLIFGQHSVKNRQPFWHPILERELPLPVELWRRLDCAAQASSTVCNAGNFQLTVL
jgi:hypothetical protein